MFLLTLIGALVAPFPQDTVPKDSVLQLEEVVVTASRSREVMRRDQPLSILTLRPDLATRSSGRVAVDLLREAMGVQVQQTSAGQGAIILRGLLGNQVLLLVDGIPLNNGTYRDGPGQYLATIDPESIERIEVIRGPASVLYGSDAQGGVVNIITRPHLDDGPGFRVTGQVSSANDGYRSRASLAVGSPALRLEVGGSFADAGDLRAGGGITQRPTGFAARGIDGRITFEPNARHRLVAAVQHFRMTDVPRYDRFVDFRASVGPGSDVDHRFDPQTRQLGYLDYRFAPGSAILTSLEATASLAIQRETRIRQRRQSDGTADPRVETWNDDVRTPGISLVGLSLARFGRQSLALTWGAEFYRDELASDGTVTDTQTGIVTPVVRTTATGTVPAGRFPDGGDASRFGIFLQAEAELHPALMISAGGRWSRFRTSAEVGTEFGDAVENVTSNLTGQVGVVIKPSTPWRIAFRVAEGFRAPNLFDLTNVGPVPGGVALPNPNATSEHSLSTEAALRFASRRTAFEVTVYRTTIHDFIDRVPGTFMGDTLFNGERVFQGINMGQARVHGFEAEAVTNVGPLRLRATLLYTNGTQKTTSGVNEPMAKIPPLGGTGRAHWALPAVPVWLEYGIRWATAQRRLAERDLNDTRIPDGGTDGFVVHSVFAGADLTDDIAISAGFENLTDKLYRDHASGVDNPGRHMWLGLSWLQPF